MTQQPQKQEDQDQKLFAKFLDRLHIFQTEPKRTFHVFGAILGIVLFIALVIAYYVLGGGG